MVQELGKTGELTYACHQIGVSRCWNIQQLCDHYPQNLSILYYYDQSFMILGKNYSKMADKFSFDLRQIKKNIFFFRCDSDVNDWL